MHIIPTKRVIEYGLLSGIEWDKCLIHEAIFQSLSGEGLGNLKGLNVQFTGKAGEDPEYGIVSAAYNEGATIVMTDAESPLIAQARGVPVKQLSINSQELGTYFNQSTMSIHLREGHYPYAKDGVPGKWEFRKISEGIVTSAMIQGLIPKDAATEQASDYATILYHDPFRIIHTVPPLSNTHELTVVRLTKSLSLEDFHPSGKLVDRMNKQAEGMLIAGAPGMGKTTFSHSLLSYYHDKGKVIKTVEAPRDSELPVTQYALRKTSHDELRDLLLLSRPDYTFFDEMRNDHDFRFYADLRLSGIGLVGVLHAKKPIDAIHRFIKRLDLGTIPQVIDTVIFIEDGAIRAVLSLQMEVRVPAGMSEKDLARPVVVVNDFETNQALFEIYSYGEETVVIPIQRQTVEASPVLAREIQNYTLDYDIEMLNNRLVVYVPRKVRFQLVGKNGERIAKLEESTGYPIDIKEKVEQNITSRERVAYSVSVTSNAIQFDVDSGGNIDFYIDDEYVLTAHASKKGQVKVRKDNIHGDRIIAAIKAGRKLALYTRGEK
ncbi:MAG: ATPase, T2SS/T4P/T4SS family [Nanobdellota archaeon]